MERFIPGQFEGTSFRAEEGTAIDWEGEGVTLCLLKEQTAVDGSASLLRLLLHVSQCRTRTHAQARTHARHRTVLPTIKMALPTSVNLMSVILT